MEAERTVLPSLSMERRPLGTTGFDATVLGIGDVADRSVPLERRAVEAVQGKGPCWWFPA
jgi:hypothetical protein